MAAYIDLNPVRAGLVSDPKDYRWCGYGEAVGGHEGALSLGQVLRLRVRYFSDGVVLGSRNYVNGVFEEFRGRFGERRRTGARPLRGVAALGHLMTLRDLRVDAVG